VTICAQDFRVRAKQWKVSKSMVEGRLVELNNNGISSLVIRMATCASAAADFREQTMKAARPLNVGADVVMAGHTQFVLGVAIEHYMTRATFALDVSVRLHDITRHDQRLDRLTACIPAHGYSKYEEDDRQERDHDSAA